jgi:Spy/CpxP family protein refolding chaperone
MAPVNHRSEETPMKAMLWSTLFLALLALPAAAQPGPDRDSRPGRIARALQLTEVQKASIQGIRARHRPDLILRRDAVQHARIDLRTALQDAATPEARLRTLYDKAAAARFDLLLAQRSVRLEVQAVLSPEQRAKAAELREHRRHRFTNQGLPD